MNVTVHLWAPVAVPHGTVAVQGSWGAGTAAYADAAVTLAAGDNDVTVSVVATAAQIKLWWAAGVGP